MMLYRSRKNVAREVGAPPRVGLADDLETNQH